MLGGSTIQPNTLVKSGFEMLGILEGEVLFSQIQQISVTRQQLDQLVLSPKGFALLFWIKLAKLPKDEREILQLPKNQYQSDFRLSIIDSNLCCSVMSSKGRVEQIFSDKRLKVNQWYLITVDLVFSGPNRMCDISIYINSYFQCEGSIPDFKPPIQTAGELSFGTFNQVPSPVGSIADIVIFSRPVREHEIREIWKEGQQDLKRDGVLSSLDKIKKRDEMRFLERTYARQMKVPLKLVAKNRQDVDSLRHGLEMKGFSTVPRNQTQIELTQEVAEQEEYNMSLSIEQSLHQFFLLNPMTLSQCRELLKHWKWVALASSVIVSGQMDTTSKISLIRFRRVLKPLKISISAEQIKDLATILKTNSVSPSNNSKEFQLYAWDFLKGLREQIIRLCGDGLEEDEIGTEAKAFLDSSDSEEEIIEHLLREEQIQQLEELREQDDSLLNSDEEGAQLGILQRRGDDSNPEALVKNIQLKRIERSRSPSSPQKLTRFGGAPSVKDVITSDLNNTEPIQAGGGHSTQRSKQTIESQKINLKAGKGSSYSYFKEEEDIANLLPISWNMGKIEVTMNRCCECAKHFDMCRHTEVQFVEHFNKVGEAVKRLFPNCTILGNVERVPQIGGFDVYLRGVGPPNERDQLGRYFIFSKASAKRFPSPQEITDALVVLSLSYGDSVELESAQTDFYLKHKHTLPRPYRVHEYPASAPLEVRPQGVSTKKVEVREKSEAPMRCTHWGCLKTFTEVNNAKNACVYHPGYYQFGSVHGLWPEGWSCCRGAWESQGCTTGLHTGIQKKKYMHLCVRHGEQNPSTDYPDSFCGQAYHEHGANQCHIHPGYLMVVDKFSGRKRWTCCQEDQFGDPCEVGEHRSVQWPEQEAKLYFYSRPVKVSQQQKQNTALKDEETKIANQFALYGRFSGYFKKVKPYPKLEGFIKKKIPKEEQDRLLKLERYCTNWACEKKFTQQHNHKRACCFHPGRWDFGHSGLKISSNASDPVLWKPHWTCCMKDWDEDGCTRGHHRGLTLSQYREIGRKYKWPDMRAQSYFKRKVSQKWQEKLDMEKEKDLAQFALRIKQIKNTFGYGGKVSTNYLPQVCDKLKLNLLMTSEDMAYYFKAQEIFNGRAEGALDDGYGNIDFQKFKAWWFATLDEMFEDPKEEEEEEELINSSHHSQEPQQPTEAHQD